MIRDIRNAIDLIKLDIHRFFYLMDCQLVSLMGDNRLRMWYVVEVKKSEICYMSSHDLTWHPDIPKEYQDKMKALMFAMYLNGSDEEIKASFDSLQEDAFGRYLTIYALRLTILNLETFIDRYHEPLTRWKRFKELIKRELEIQAPPGEKTGRGTYKI